MRVTKVLFLLLFAGVLIIGCGGNDTEEPGESGETGVTSPGMVVDYSLSVSGIPMMEEMTFNYQFCTDGERGRMSSESIIPAGEKVRKQSLAHITNIPDSVQTYMNEVTKTYATINFPDPSTVPPSTAPDASIEVEPTGDTKMILGTECREVTVNLEVSKVGAGGTSTTALTGNLWVSDSFPGYDLYQAFQSKSRDVIGESRLQGSGYFEFLTRSGFSRSNLTGLYSEVGGFPFEGDLELVLNKGSQNQTNIKTSIKVSSVSAEPVQQSMFEIPEDYTEVEVGQVMSPGN